MLFLLKLMAFLGELRFYIFFQHECLFKVLVFQKKLSFSEHSHESKIVDERKVRLSYCSEL
jgi:hypothetical protein